MLTSRRRSERKRASGRAADHFDRGAVIAWDPSQYIKFAVHALRPAIELLTRIDVSDPAHVVDLGAGAGNVTRMLKDRWPHAHGVGVDDSAEMLAKAAAVARDVTWQQADLA